MAKPRVFVSSTYYDLKHIRASIENFIHSLGYEPILFESGDIPFHHDKSLDHSCYESVDSAHIFVLIIGGRYGSAASGSSIQLDSDLHNLNQDESAYEFYNSITLEEYKRARQQDIPIYIFVEKGVSAEYLTYKENRDIPNIRYAHVDNVGIFKLLDSINSESRNNLIREFERHEHITNWLKSQWAGLFTDHLTKKKTDAVLRALTSQVQTLNQVVDALKTYSEAIVRKVEPDTHKSDEIINDVEGKLVKDIINNNRLIQYINMYHKAINNDSDLSTSEILQAIAISPSLIQFIENLPISDEVKNNIKSVETEAQEDFFTLKSQLSEIKSIRPPVAHDSNHPNHSQQIVPRLIRKVSSKK